MTKIVDIHGTSFALEGAGIQLSVHPPFSALPAHAHAGAHICITLAGSYLDLSPRCELEQHPGDALLYEAGKLHRNRFGASGAWCLNLAVPDGARSARHLRRLSPARRAMAQQLASAALWGRDGDVLLMESLAEDLTDAVLGGEEEISPAPVDGVIEALEDMPCKAWTLRELAAIAGRHPSHLARSFRRATGLTIGQYRRRRRAMAVTVALHEGVEPLSDLAIDYGYADQAHMTREVVAFTGLSPGRWRRSRREG